MREIAIQKNMQNEAAAIIPTLQYIDGGSFAITKPSNEGSFFRPAVYRPETWVTHVRGHG
jgi:hypothetical protein